MAPQQTSCLHCLRYDTSARLRVGYGSYLSARGVRFVPVSARVCLCATACMSACAKIPLPHFDGKGDNLIRTLMHTRGVPDSYPMHTRCMMHAPTHTSMQ